MLVFQLKLASLIRVGVRRLPGGKIDAIATQVGYRSRKNFNDAFRQVTGLTPTAFRRLPAQRASEIVDSLDRVSATYPRSRTNG